MRRLIPKHTLPQPLSEGYLRRPLSPLSQHILHGQSVCRGVYRRGGHGWPLVVSLRCGCAGLAGVRGGGCAASCTPPRKLHLRGPRTRPQRLLHSIRVCPTLPLQLVRGFGQRVFLCSMHVPLIRSLAVGRAGWRSSVDTPLVGAAGRRLTRALLARLRPLPQLCRPSPIGFWRGLAA